MSSSKEVAVPSWISNKACAHNPQPRSAAPRRQRPTQGAGPVTQSWFILSLLAQGFRRCAVAALRMRCPFVHTERLEVWQLLASAPARAGSASIIKRMGASSAARRMQSADRQLRNVRKQGGGIRPLPTCLRTLHPLACRRIKCGVRTPCLVRTRVCGELCRGSAHSSVSSSRFGLERQSIKVKQRCP